jgi:hypothetical protein
MPPQWLFEALWQRHHPVLRPLPVADDDEPIPEVYVPDAQPHALHEPHTGPPRQLSLTGCRGEGPRGDGMREDC